MRLLALMAMGVGLAGGQLLAQEPNTTAVSTTTNTPPDLSEKAPEKAWSFSLAAYTYLLPESHDYVQPTFTADRGGLHLEARYNYEALDTGSAWVGYNFSGGKKLTWQFTPMLGGVFGELNGVAPGYEFTLDWWKLQLYSEAEYVFDLGHSSDSYCYTWSELSLAPVDWFRFGVVVQRTRAYEADREVQRGVLVGFTYKSLDLSGYMFNPDDDNPTFVVAVTLTF